LSRLKSEILRFFKSPLGCSKYAVKVTFEIALSETKTPPFKQVAFFLFYFFRFWLILFSSRERRGSSRSPPRKSHHGSSRESSMVLQSCSQFQATSNSRTLEEYEGYVRGFQERAARAFFDRHKVSFFLFFFFFFFFFFLVLRTRLGCWSVIIL
jgi:hypothetical protein